MKFEFKITTWERVEVSEKDEARVFEAIKNGSITSAQGIFDFLEDHDDVECNGIDDTDEQMFPSENDNQSTIEVRDGENVIWDNSII